MNSFVGYPISFFIFDVIQRIREIFEFGVVDFDFFLVTTIHSKPHVQRNSLPLRVFPVTYAWWYFPVFDDCTHFSSVRLLPVDRCIFLVHPRQFLSFLMPRVSM